MVDIIQQNGKMATVMISRRCVVSKDLKCFTLFVAFYLSGIVTFVVVGFGLPKILPWPLSLLSPLVAIAAMIVVMIWVRRSALRIIKKILYT